MAGEPHGVSGGLRQDLVSIGEANSFGVRGQPEADDVPAERPEAGHGFMLNETHGENDLNRLKDKGHLRKVEHILAATAELTTKSSNSVNNEQANPTKNNPPPKKKKTINRKKE